VLQVAVHGDDELALGVVEAGGKGRGLAEIAAQFDDHHAAVHGGDLAEQGEGGVARAVVYKDQSKLSPTCSMTTFRRHRARLRSPARCETERQWNT